MTSGYIKVKFKDKTEEEFAVDDLDQSYIDGDFVVIRISNNNMKMINRDCVESIVSRVDSV